MPVEVAYCGEGATDAAVARALIRAAGGIPGMDYVTRRGRKGKFGLDSRLQGFNIAAARRLVLVLRDLDSDADCPGQLASRLLPDPAQGLCLRVAVRSVESWLLADRAGFAAAARVRINMIPDRPEALERPKRAVINALRTSRSRELRQIADERGGGMEPQRLAGFLIPFAEEQWDVRLGAASGASPSLTRALLRLGERIRRA